MLGVIDCLGCAAFIVVLAGRHAAVHEAHVARSLGCELEVIVIAFDLKRFAIRADSHARRFESVKQPAGFFADVGDPFAEISARRAVTFAFEPEEMRMSRGN